MTPRGHDPIDALPRAALDRLDRFAEAFHTLDSGLYPAFAAMSLDVEERRVALERIQAIIGPGSRRAGILAALAGFREFAVRAATEALGGASAELLTRTNPASPEERVSFLASLELAVAVVLLWDEIEPDERADLLGPWGEMAERAAEGR